MELLLDLLFPPKCVNCGIFCSGNWICDTCYKEIKQYLNKNEIDEYYYVFKYEGLIRKLLIEYKFFDATYILNFFVNEIIKNEKIIGKIFFYDIIIPVPMSIKKERKRGYNQTFLIASKLAKKLKKKCYKALCKKEGIKQQAKLNRIERMQNVKDAFYINKYYIDLIKNKNIMLLDDIYTTGATVNECVKVLKNNGVNNIFVITLSRELEG